MNILKISRKLLFINLEKKVKTVLYRLFVQRNFKILRKLDNRECAKLVIK